MDSFSSTSSLFLFVKVERDHLYLGGREKVIYSYLKWKKLIIIISRIESQEFYFQFSLAASWVCV